MFLENVWNISQFNTLRPRQNGRRFADDTFKRIFLNENVRFSIKISLKFVPKGPINNNPALVQIMAWRRSGDKPLSEPMMASLLMHICVTRPRWVNSVFSSSMMYMCARISSVPLPCIIYPTLLSIPRVIRGQVSVKMAISRLPLIFAFPLTLCITHPEVGTIPCFVLLWIPKHMIFM